MRPSVSKLSPWLCAGLVTLAPLAGQDRTGAQDRIAAQDRKASGADDGAERLTVSDTTPPGPTVSFNPRTPRGRFGPDADWFSIAQRGEDGMERRHFATRTLRALDGEPPAADAADDDAAAAGPALRTRGGRVAVVPPGDGAPRLLAAGGAREAHLAPGREQASFVRGNDLYIAPLASDGRIWRVTDDGSEQRLHGVLDWVHQEEVYGRGDFQGHWWSPDGDKVAFLTLDQSRVKPFTVVDHVPARELAAERAVRAEVTKYPKAGDPNPVASLSIAKVGERRVIPVDLARYGDAEILLVRHAWTPDSSGLIVQVQDRIQTWLDVNRVDAETGELTHLFRETSPTWVNVLGQPRWLEDGSFLWFSERTGYRNLYRYDQDGALLSTLTDVPWNVLGIEHLDEARGLVWLTGTGVHAIDRHLFRTSLDGAGELEQLTQGRGMHRVRLAEDVSRGFFDEVSTVETLPELRLCAADGTIREVWPSTPASAVAKYGLHEKRLHTIPARDGFPLDATLILPDDGERPLPILVDTYSGPDAPSVRNRYRHSAWHQFLAQEGIAVLQVNVRSASGRGQIVIGTCYRQFGVQELRDLEDAVAWVVAEHGGDPERVGIRGYSYGGFMAAYALTHSERFALGIAGAGVYDWQLYDTIYTERFMSTPQANPAGYAESSVIEAAGDLHGHLVLVHGTMDDNVHLQNTVRLVDALQREGEDDFTLMIYPRSRHGVGSSAQRAHMRRLSWRAIQTHLQRPQ